MIDAAHDVSAGGLAAALVEACLRFNTGARIGLGEVAERDGLDLFTLLFSESLGRVVGFGSVVLRQVRFKDYDAPLASFPFARIGVVDAESNALDFQDEFPLTWMSCVQLTRVLLQLTSVRLRRASLRLV